MAQIRGTGSAGGSALDKFHFLWIHEAKLTSRLSVIRASDGVSAKQSQATNRFCWENHYVSLEINICKTYGVEREK